MVDGTGLHETGRRGWIVVGYQRPPTVGSSDIESEGHALVRLYNDGRINSSRPGTVLEDDPEFDNHFSESRADPELWPQEIHESS